MSSTHSAARPDNYFTEKYGLTATHSEILHAVQIVPPGKALDIGCGRGRNSLFLNQKGFDVTAWDINSESISFLNNVINQENLSNIAATTKDLNAERFNFHETYDFVVSTVVFMFLKPQTIPSLIADMQSSTKKDGYNLIVAAMDSPDLPALPMFPFTFKPGELKAYYSGWELVKYNEDIGELHRIDAQGNRIKQHFATLLAKK